MTLQRYVSGELTHFVGRGSDDPEQQYRILVDAILKGGWLKHSPGAEAPLGPVEALEAGGLSMSIAPNDPDVPPGESFRSQVVCFCDIPVEDLQIHVRKYSPFGLSFLKPFLVEKGANPVFYVASNSPALQMLAGRENEPIPGNSFPREGTFRHNARAYNDLFHELTLGDAPRHDNGLLVGHPEQHMKTSTIQSFLNFYVFSFVKYFDDTTSDEDPENFYMEREWRVLGDVNFGLKDVYRVFLPSAYAERFRHDLPDYTGQVTFVEA